MQTLTFLHYCLFIINIIEILIYYFKYTIDTIYYSYYNFIINQRGRDSDGLTHSASYYYNTIRAGYAYKIQEGISL